ncbi:transcription factor E2F5 isoform X2 [Carassius auratus]|uniref:Transcription factor E2F5 isoform X2 n=1 Tax=Carassius auratus TaxID=7957 RepID=A0A6P6JQG7_CARAU|nr:transcription factor E2F5-like isoform X2 [Carassius auratus]
MRKKIEILNYIPENSRLLDCMAESNSASSHTTPNGSSRHEKSLGLLTVKFVTLLQEAKDGVLDLKVAADSLAVKQKRRIYDITNVLEGVGLIEKKTKNTIQWKGESSGCQSQEVLEQVELLKANIADLEIQERELDMQKACLQQGIKHLNEDSSSCRYSYVTHEDVCDAFSGDTLLTVMAPSGTQLEVPVPEMGQNGQKKYQVNLRSHSAPIQVMLINREMSCSKPVVVCVPPIDDISAILTPPNTPAGVQRFPISSAELCDLKRGPLKSPTAEHQLTQSSTSPDMLMGSREQ